MVLQERRQGIQQKTLMAVRSKLLAFSACAGLTACGPSPHEAYESNPSVMCAGVGGYAEAAIVIAEAAALAEEQGLQFRVFGERIDSTEEPYWVFVYFPDTKMYLATGFEGQGGHAYFSRHRELSESVDDHIMQLADQYLGDEFECEPVQVAP